MKSTFVLLVGLLVGCAPWTCSRSRHSGLSEPPETAASGLLGTSIHSPFSPSPLRPSARDDILETPTSEEEEDEYPEVRNGGVASLAIPDPYSTPYGSLPLLPRRLEAVSLRQRPSSWLLC
ncbi:MAG: hypothetical protein ACXWNF_13015 [Isosphaeraceae bacterium]